MSTSEQKPRKGKAIKPILAAYFPLISWHFGITLNFTSKPFNPET